MKVQVLASRRVLLSAIAVMLFITLPPTPVPVGAQPAAEFVSVTDAMLETPSPSDWLMWRRTLDGWGYSPLDQIDHENVGDLRMVWTRALATGRQEGTPLVYDGVLYMPQSDDVIEAIEGPLDAGDPAGDRCCHRGP